MARKPGLVAAAVGALLAAACSGGPPPEAGPPIDPHPAGEAVEVGGWYPMETTLVGTAAEVERTGSRQSDGWTVTVVAPSGDCPTDPMSPQKGVVCIGLEIHNDTAGPGGLDTYGGADDLPLLADPAGQVTSPIGMRIAGMEWAELGTYSADCTFAPPDDEGRQQADCAALLVLTHRSGVGGEETIGWLTVGAGKTADYVLRYSDPAQSGIALRWPDGTWLALP